MNPYVVSTSSVSLLGARRHDVACLVHAELFSACELRAGYEFTTSTCEVRARYVHVRNTHFLRESFLIHCHLFCVPRRL